MGTGWRPEVPFDDLPEPPSGESLETKLVLKACIAARTALADLKRAAELLPNQSVLINTIPLLEARASSEIENIVTTSDQLFRYRDLDEQADSATKEALRYSHALLVGFKVVKERPLTTNTAEEVCSLLKGTEMRVRSFPGTAIARSGGKIVYTPPQGERVIRNHLRNWEKFLHERRELDPLVRMAAGHYQFEAIHPFADGNGRTGRILNVLFLIQEGLLTLPILYLSRYIIHHKPDYYRLLLDVTRSNAWEPWLLYMLRGVEETAQWTTAKIEAIRTLITKTAERVRKEAPKLYSHELVNVIFEQPYCRIQNLVQAELGNRQSASRHLKALTNIKVLEETQVGRDKLFINRELMDLLTKEDEQAETQ
jgi:Fic family protein